MPQQLAYAQLVLIDQRRPLANESGLAQKVYMGVSSDCLVWLLAPQLAFDQTHEKLRATLARFELEFMQVQ